MSWFKHAFVHSSTSSLIWTPKEKNLASLPSFNMSNNGFQYVQMNRHFLILWVLLCHMFLTTKWPSDHSLRRVMPQFVYKDIRQRFLHASDQFKHQMKSYENTKTEYQKNIIFIIRSHLMKTLDWSKQVKD